MQIVSQKHQVAHVIDSSLFDKRFLTGLAAHSSSLRLHGNTLMSETDTVTFPQDIPLRKRIVFHAFRNGTTYSLHATRINLTNIAYIIRISAKNTLARRWSGVAILSPVFYLAGESDEDDMTGASYLSTEYRSADDSITIRIGSRDDNNRLRAIIAIRKTKRNGYALVVEDCPTLRAR
ncbi:MAG: hypothetical protein JNL32_05795 [Candidatus Kapabacteria bacterium]|nr:hypothetical protein [Candidatus Kapabacteria bacterium]